MEMLEVHVKYSKIALMSYPKVRSKDDNWSFQKESPDYIESYITGPIGIPISVSRTQVRHIEMSVAQSDIILFVIKAQRNTGGIAVSESNTRIYCC